MKRIISFFSFGTMLFVLSSCSDQQKSSAFTEGMDAFSSDSLAKHIATISGDDFMGRKPFSKGETKTIEYIKDQYTSLGLEPGNGNSFFQDVPMVKITTAAAPVMEVSAATGDFKLNGPADYVVWTDRTDSVLSFKKDEVIFAGYGVVAPEYNWNDYAGIDVKGKIGVGK